MTKHSISIMTVWKWKNRVLNKEKDPSQFTVYTKIGLNVKTIADRLAEKMGISLSEYIRWLIINDLKKRTTLTETIKEE